MRAVKKTIAWVECKRIKYGTNTRTNNGTRIQGLRKRQRFRLTSVSIEPGSAAPWGLTRTTNRQLARRGGARYLRRRSKSPSASDKAVMISASLISRWSFGVLPLSRQQRLSVGRCRGSLGPQPGAARCQESDLAGGARVLFLLYPRPLGTSPRAGRTDEVGVVTFVTVTDAEEKRKKNNEATVNRWILEDQERITAHQWQSLLVFVNKYCALDLPFECENATGKTRTAEKGQQGLQQPEGKYDPADEPAGPHRRVVS
ncbi:hypothetical protein T01_6722 [Trichinella spiralis]|uniref:Uncharacterized protein n=1 Tax=Trichinella spiralis TaxID=6334 RepID=A0A0V1AS84_TRISP|nr:hypothetical protein T01_6722 [Trichinella spiralis]